jgi:hypothetical protein
MVFLAGPRQSGKTTLAKSIATSFRNQVYFNWDTAPNKSILIERPAFFENLNRKDASTPVVIFDEIHKYRKWKNYLKGIYDGYADRYQFLVLGSGRLNIFQKGGDSLAGRYFLFRMHPFTLAELGNRRTPFDQFIKRPLDVPSSPKRLEGIWNELSHLSGFPEPFLSGKKTHYNRWSLTYRHQLIKEDIRNMTDIRNIDQVEMLFDLLPSKVGSPLSMDGLGGDLQVSPNTIKHWIENFERFYMAFRIKPWSKRLSRAIKKERKLYLYDYAGISDPGVQFENKVAVELNRAVTNWTDLGLGTYDLYYLRNKEKQEVDFLITEKSNPVLLIEAKSSETQPEKSLLKFQSKLNIPAVQLVDKPNVYKVYKNGDQSLLVISAVGWLSMLP